MKSIDNLSEIDLNLLVAFLAIYEERSVTAAAQRLFLGQPAMSAALKRLRSLLADDLFIRVGRTMQPTRKAEAIAPEIRAILEQLEQLLATNQTFDPATARRGVAIGTSDYASLVVMPHLLTHCAMVAPGLDFQLIGFEKDDAAMLLEQGTVELVLGVFPEAPRQTEMVPLFEEYLVGIARKDHPVIESDHISLEDFARLYHVLHTLRRDRIGYVDSLLDEAGFKRRIAVTTSHMLIIPSLVAASDLVALIPSRIAMNCSTSGTLQQFKPPIATKPWSMAMVWSCLADADPLNQWLRETLISLGSTL